MLGPDQTAATITGILHFYIEQSGDTSQPGNSYTGSEVRLKGRGETSNELKKLKYNIII